MASTTFVNYQTVIDAGWLNDVNSAVYSGTFQASTITPTNVTSSGAISGATVAGTTSVTTPIVKSGTSLSLQTNGSTTAVTIDTAQNVGVGVTPNAWNISGYKFLQFTDATSAYVGGSGYAATIGANSYINNSGNWVRAGASYAVSQLNQFNGQFTFQQAAAGSVGSTITWIQAMTLDNSGNLCVGTTSAGGYKVNIVGGSSYAMVLSNNSSGINLTCVNAGTGSQVYQAFYVNTSTQTGSISTNGTTTSYNITSDRRLKTNIVDFTDSGKYIDGFKPRKFNWIADNSEDIGFITDEYQQNLPSAISGQPDATIEEEYEVTPAVKDEQGNITTPAVMGTRTVPIYQQGDFSTSAKMAIIIAELQSLRARLKAANIA